MDKAQVEEQVCEIIGVVLRRGGPVPAHFRRREESQWDSLKHAEILFTVEEQFQIRFSEADLEKLDSAPGIAARVRELLEP